MPMPEPVLSDEVAAVNPEEVHHRPRHRVRCFLIIGLLQGAVLGPPCIYTIHLHTRPLEPDFPGPKSFTVDTHAQIGVEPAWLRKGPGLTTRYIRRVASRFQTSLGSTPRAALRYIYSSAQLSAANNNVK